MATEHSLRATIDRLERDARGQPLAVLVFDDEQQLAVPQAVLPDGSRPGDVLALTFGADHGETHARADQIEDLQRKLFGE